MEVEIWELRLFLSADITLTLVPADHRRQRRYPEGGLILHAITCILQISFHGANKKNIYIDLEDWRALLTWGWDQKLHFIQNIWWAFVTDRAIQSRLAELLSTVWDAGDNHDYDNHVNDDTCSDLTAPPDLPLKHHPSRHPCIHLLGHQLPSCKLQHGSLNFGTNKSKLRPRYKFMWDNWWKSPAREKKKGVLIEIDPHKVPPLICDHCVVK